MGLAKPPLQLLEPSNRIAQAGCQRFRHPHLIPERLDAFAPSVELRRCDVFLRLAHGHAARPITGLDEIRQIGSVDGRDVPALDRAADRVQRACRLRQPPIGEGILDDACFCFDESSPHDGIRMLGQPLRKMRSEVIEGRDQRIGIPEGESVRPTSRNRRSSLASDPVPASFAATTTARTFLTRLRASCTSPPRSSRRFCSARFSCWRARTSSHDESAASGRV